MCGRREGGGWWAVLVGTVGARSSSIALWRQTHRKACVQLRYGNIHIPSSSASAPGKQLTNQQPPAPSHPQGGHFCLCPLCALHRRRQAGLQLLPLLCQAVALGGQLPQPGRLAPQLGHLQEGKERKRKTRGEQGSEECRLLRACPSVGRSKAGCGLLEVGGHAGHLEVVVCKSKNQMLSSSHLLLRQPAWPCLQCGLQLAASSTQLDLCPFPHSMHLALQKTAEKKLAEDPLTFFSASRRRTAA